MKTLFTHPFRRQYHWGYLCVAVSLLVSYGLWLGSMWAYDDWYDSAWTYPAKVGSHGATLLMCWAFLLATRFRPIERLFGGLDKVYKAHRYIGEGAFLLIFLHPLCLAMPLLPDWAAWLSYFWFSHDWARNTGIVALLGFALLVTLSIYVKIRYHRWKRSHDFFGLLLVLVIVHGLLAQGEIARYPALQIWFGIWCGLGLAAYVYIRLLYRWIGPQYDYRVAAVHQVEPDITELHFEAIGRRLRHAPGQFIYLSLDTQAVSSEPHPFSISSAPESEHLRLSIKRLGDWTASVRGVEVGEPARIWGPYGHFADALDSRPARDAVFLAGGIGITPFLSIVGSAAFASRPARHWMIASVPRPAAALYHHELRERAAVVEHLQFVAHCSDDAGFIDRAYLERQVGSLADKEFFICGPNVMMSALSDLLLKAGVPLEQIHYEDFAIR